MNHMRLKKCPPQCQITPRESTSIVKNKTVSKDQRRVWIFRFWNWLIFIRSRRHGGCQVCCFGKILLATEFKLPWDVEKERLRVLFQLLLGWEVSFMIQSTIFSTYNKIRRCSVLKLKNAHIIYNVCQNDCQRVSYCDPRKIFMILFFIWILGWYTCDPRTAYVTVSYSRKY